MPLMLTMTLTLMAWKLITLITEKASEEMRDGREQDKMSVVSHYLCLTGGGWGQLGATVQAALMEVLTNH